MLFPYSDINSVLTYPAFDMNTPRVVTDGTKKVLWHLSPFTGPFGKTIPKEDPDGDGQAFTLNLRFTSQYYDRETNTHYNYYQDGYRPDLGRW